MIPFLIILAATAENVWPLIAGLVRTPAGYVFLGTIHYPADYFYYLSQFAQGSYRTLTTIDLFTSEPIGATFVGWSNVLTGRLFHLVGLSPFIAYHTSVVILTVMLLIAGYKLARVILSGKPAAVLALYFFAIFHAFPIMRDGSPSYGDYWNNFAVPRVRLGGVPHQLLLNTAAILLVYAGIVWEKKKKHLWSDYALAGISSLVLASLQPVLWASIVGITILTNLITKKSLTVLIPLLVGLLPIVYLTKLFQTLPFSQLKLWEATQQTLLTPEHFLTATGPIFLLALFSVPHGIARRSFAYQFTILYSLFSLFFFLSPIPALMGISHVRFMSTLTIFFVSIIASHGVSALYASKQMGLKVTGVILVIGVSLILLPAHQKMLALATTFTPDNQYHYLPKEAYAFLRSAGSQSTPEDTFLIEEPYAQLFPALTGRRSVYGHPLLTIHAQTKQEEAREFFRGTLTPSDARAYLTANHVTAIIALRSTSGLVHLSFLTQTSASESLILYRLR